MLFRMRNSANNAVVSWELPDAKTAVSFARGWNSGLWHYWLEMDTVEHHEMIIVQVDAGNGEIHWISEALKAVSRVH